MELKKGKGKLTSFSRFLDKKYGKPNMKKRAKFDKEAYNFVYRQILQEKKQ